MDKQLINATIVGVCEQFSSEVEIRLFLACVNDVLVAPDSVSNPNFCRLNDLDRIADIGLTPESATALKVYTRPAMSSLIIQPACS